VLGGLFFGHKEPGVFTEEAERLAVGVAAQAAIAIERAQLYVREHQARAEAEQRAYAALSLEHVNDGVCLVDADGMVRIWNPAAALITGLQSSAVVGLPLREALPALAAVAEEVTQRAEADAVVPSRTVQAEFGDRELWLALSGIRFGDGVVYTFRDRSEELRIEQLRSDLIATVSHELRTPLAAVYGAAQTIARRDLSDQPEVREQLIGMIAAETERLGRVVSEILLASELETLREPRWTTSAVDVAAVARRVVDLAAHRADGVELQLEVESDELPPVTAESDRLQQVLGNLVDNALKYGASGDRVLVRLSVVGDCVRIAVVDHGPGIPFQEAQRIFDRFYRLDPGQRDGVAGTGLGLYIARRFIREMGGELWLEATPGGGATFVVELDAAPAAPADG
jgi:two-component system phosphate regulon sensor histidine kinase PhoR